MKSTYSFFLAAFSMAASTAYAADGTWGADASGTWSDTATWASGTVADGDAAVANFAFNITATRTITLDSNRTVGTLLFNDLTTASNDWVLNASGGSVLTLSTGGAGTPTINVVNRTATINAGLDLSSGFQKTGGGALVLNGPLTNWDDAFVNNVTAGSLTLGASSGAVFTFGNVSKTLGNATVQYNAVDAGSLTLSTYDVGTGTIALGQNSTYDGTAGFTKTGNGTFAINAGTLNAAGTYNIIGNFNVAATLAGSTSFTKAGAGTMTLTNNANSFTGAANVTGGVLQLGNLTTNNTTFAYAGSGISVGSGSTLRLGSSSGGNITVNYSFNNLTAPISVDGGTLHFAQTNNTNQNFNGNVAFSNTSTVNLTASAFGGHSAIFNGNITGTGTLNFTATGGTARNYTIAGTSNNYTGNVTLGNADASTTFTLNQALGAASWTINDTDWRVNLSNTTHTMTSLNSSQAAVEIRGNGVASILNVGSGNGNDTYAGILTQTASNSLAVVKSGTGTMTLTGANAYTGGTTINEGKVLFNGNSSGATGMATVASGATIGGTGSYGGALNVTGTLSPGASIESFATGAVTLNNGSIFAYEFNSSALNGDLLVVNGSLDLNVGATLSMLDLGSGVLNVGDKLTLINYTGAWNGGTFNGLADDTTFTSGSNQWLINYNDTAGGTNFTGEQTGLNFVTVTVVPEPSIALLSGLSLLGLLRRRRN